MTTTLPLEGSADELRRRIAGDVLTPTDSGFDAACRAWNLSYRHRPALLVVPTSPADVATAVSHAASVNLAVTIQATGHGVIRAADGGMLVLLHRLDEVTVDAETWTARIGAGAKWEQVLGPATRAGLAPLLGSTPDVSAVGYTLGGGMGWLARRYGLAADHVRSLEVVTADGVIRRASPTTEPDLFWALRGAGAGSLGVVTAMEIDLVPVTSVYAGNLFYPAEAAREVGARYRDWVRDAPDALTSSLSFMNFPPLDEVPEPLRGRSFAIVRGASLGSDDEGEALLDFWRGWKRPEVDAWGRMPFADVASISNDPTDPMPGLSTSAWLEGLTDPVLDILARTLFEGPPANPLVFAEVRHAGGAVGREPAHANAYGHRHQAHLLQIVAVTPTAGDAAAAELRILAAQGELAPHTAPGVYLNFLEGDEKVRRSAEGFDGASWERLRRIKHEVDPTNLFRNGLAVA